MASVTTSEKKIYDSQRLRNPAIEELREIVQFKDLIYQLIRRDIVTRYKRSVLGVLWTMLNPLGTMVVMSIVFSRMFEMRGVYPAFIITNLVAWNFFSQTTTTSLNTMLWGSDLFQRIYLPRTAFVVSTIGTGVVNVLFSLVPLVLIYLVTKVPLHASLLFLPVAILSIAAFALGFSLILSTFVVFFSDISEMYPILLTAWMYLTPIIYPETMIEDVLNGWLLRLNPLHHLIKFFRTITFNGEYPTMMELGLAVGIGFGTLLIGWVFFTQQSKKFSYYV